MHGKVPASVRGRYTSIQLGDALNLVKRAAVAASERDIRLGDDVHIATVVARQTPANETGLGIIAAVGESKRVEVLRLKRH